MVEEALQLVLLVESATILQIEVNLLQVEKHGHFLEIEKVEQELLVDLIDLLVAVVLVLLVFLAAVLHHTEAQEFKLISMEITGTGVAVAVVLVVLPAMGQVVMVASVVVETEQIAEVQIMVRVELMVQAEAEEELQIILDVYREPVVQEL